MSIRKPHPDPFEEWGVFLRHVSIFADLDEDTLRAVAHKVKPLSLPKGAVLYREGEQADALYVLQSGHVKVVTKDDHGKEKVVNYLGRGDAFGEISLLTGSPRSVTAKVDSTAQFLVLYKKDFESFLKKDPTAAFYLSRLISRRFLAASKAAMVPLPNPEILGFLCEAPKEDRLTFLCNLSMALVEQTRRKILLLTLAPEGDELARALRLPLPPHGSNLRADDLLRLRSFERWVTTHPSGMEIAVLPEGAFQRISPRVVPALSDILRENYDYVLMDVAAIQGSLSGGPRFPEPVLAVLRECDAIFQVTAGSGSAPEVPPASSEGTTLRWIALGSANAAERAPDFILPWSSQAADRFRRGEPPLLDFPEGARAQRMLERIARHIGKIKVGFAMGSGAAYGYAIIGILKVFERENIPIDFVSGTSMGALLGSFFAAGRTALEIESIAHTITKVWLRRNILRDLNLPWPHGGLLVGETISRFLRSVLGEVDFKDLPIPFACAATDIMTGDPVVLREGKVWRAVRASLSLPLVFCPYKLGGRYLVDGGLVNPVPTSIIASMGADLLISANVTSKVSERRVSLRRLGMFPASSPGMGNVFFKMLYTMQYQIASARTELAHIVIRPEMGNFSWVDLHRARQIIPLGEEAAEDALARIKSRLPYFTDFCPVPQRIRLPSSY